MSWRLPLLAAVLALAATPAAAGVTLDCATTPGCSLVRAVPAGADSLGQAITLFEFRFETARSWAADVECLNGFREFWSEAGGVESFITDLCDTSYENSGGPETAAITANRLVKDTSGGAAWDWMEKTTYQLSPPLVLQEDWVGAAPWGDFVHRRWDWMDFSGGASEVWEPPCGDRADNAEGGSAEEDEVPPVDDISHFLLIPQLHRESLPQGFDEADLGTCALQLATWPASGFLLEGDPRDARWPGPSLRVLAYDPDNLMVTTELWHGATDVALEIWQRPVYTTASDSVLCPEPIHQWIVNLADGSVSAGDGKLSGAPTVLSRRETTDADGVTRTTLQLRLHSEGSAITVALAGRGDPTPWRLASSRLVAGEPRSLGETLTLDSDKASCGIRDGRLDVLRWGAPITEWEKEGRW